MAQTITIANATYPDVPSIVCNKQGGGTAVFADPSGTTAAASDVAQGKLFLNASGVLTQGTASGGGGASNLVTGTFTGTSNGVLEVTPSYSGSGYPLAVVIYPSEGAYNPNGTFYNTVARYAVIAYWAIKAVPTTTPTYSGGNNDGAVVQVRYKSSGSSATTISSNGTQPYSLFNTTDPIATNGYQVVKFSSNKLMKVYISSASYCFRANVEYKYWIIYSS